MIVLHHTDPDGFGSAYICGLHHPDATFVPCNYDQVEVVADTVNVNDLLYYVRDEAVVLLDFSLPQEDIEALCDVARSVLVIDHHRSSDGLKGIERDNFRFVHDTDKAAIRLTWETFCPHWPVHWVVDYIEDRDLWRKELDNTDAVSARIYATPMTFLDWDTLFEEEGPARAAKEGRAMLEFQDRMTNDAIDEAAVLVAFEGHVVPAVNSPLLRSEIGNDLSKDHPFVIIYYRRSDGLWHVSMRSSRENPDSVTVREIAERRGGGGHPHAAGFSCQTLPF